MLGVDCEDLGSLRCCKVAVGQLWVAVVDGSCVTTEPPFSDCDPDI
jgi:hypothetical protein